MSSLASSTAYVLLGSIEADLRNIVEHFADEDDLPAALGVDIINRAQDRRTKDGYGKATTVTQLLPYIDFQESFDAALRIKNRLPEDLSKGLAGLHPRIISLVPIRNRVAHNRPLEFEDLSVVVDATDQIINIPGFQWTNLENTRTSIHVEPTAALKLSKDLISDPESAVAHNLPIPDFDETSLLGRRDEKKAIRKKLASSWPVVTVLGDGGIGKTALALQICYDLVQDPKCSFDAIVWVSAKNTELTSNEIRKIEGAVTDSLGFYASASIELGGDPDSNRVVDDLIDAMGALKMLLVLDNVETVLDEAFGTLLEDIPQGSKVLITSRIGVRTETPFKLQGLSSDDSVKLLRILAKTRGIDILKNTDTDQLNNWASRMQGRPAYLKWFVAGIQSGRSPEELLDDNGLVLEFCMSNVFEHLSEDTKTVLTAMTVVPGAHTNAELAYLTGFDAQKMRLVALEATNTNFVQQVRSGAVGSALELSDFAREYLRRTLQTSPASRKTFIKRQKDLYATGGGIQLAHERDPYSPQTIDTRGVGDYSAAKLLRQALEEFRDSNPQPSFDLVSEAARLAPGYHEAARVEGRLHELMMNFHEAYEAYSKARDLADQSSHVHYFFGTFLINSHLDINAGLRELQLALKLDQSSTAITAAICSAHAMLDDYDSVYEVAKFGLGQTETSQDYHREALWWLLKGACERLKVALSSGDWELSSDLLDGVLVEVDQLKESPIDTDCLDMAFLLETIATNDVFEIEDSYASRNMRNFARRLNTWRISKDKSHSERFIGEVNFVSDKGFGFAHTGSGKVFFHAKDFSSPDTFDNLREGSKVAFYMGMEKRSGNPPAIAPYWVE